MAASATLTPSSTNANGGVTQLDVIIVGGGFGGMYAVYKFNKLGLKLQAFEAGTDVGGVWYWNRYPGARVDLPSIDYSYSFSPEIEQEWSWSEQFAAQPELLRYIDFVATRLDLRRHFQFSTRVESAVWDEERQLWTVKTNKGETFEAPYCIMATGPLSVPKKPEIDGLERFKGKTMYAARWPHTPVDFSGQRVGVIGTGSTGIQIVQEVGRQNCELFVFQRTPSFTMPMRNVPMEPEYMAEVKRHYPAIREVARNSPIGGIRPQSTRGFFTVTPAQRMALLEDSWQQGGLAMLGTFGDLMLNEEANEHVAEFVRGKIAEVVTDPATAEALKPKGYPIFARRPCLDTGYYETYNRPNVHLMDCIADPILEITEKGIRTAKGETELDVLILATGYDGLTGALMAFDVVGRDGRTVQDKWKNGPRSHLGIMLEGFPNLFMTTGPNGPAALANIIRMSENDVDWIADAILHLRKNGLGSIEPTKKTEDDWMDLVHSLAKHSLINKAKTWWVGANVEGKPQGLTQFIGGFAKYREACAAAAANGYAGHVKEPARQAVEA
ncbi:flavin-containing monooxygenase [Hydrogenophaga sp. BPS33]|uniref:flavin-containing monooxygenase n=1 Tax=Hydrogenophaga sp. BPS33 TaxID=2651974 RepID=UPI00131F99A3|nr:NAD(P)/FAD-dependent oxidoreductase [Hydrogenophaga sp. BPS33]QHE84526.1 NAD(P)/FAD-dependent oxidoreductase [Hydrogenophaga sp. BPS33]